MLVNKADSIAYTLIESTRRKTIAIQIKQGEVFVRAPSGICTDYVQGFVATKSQWLQAKLKEYQQIAKQSIQVTNGAMVPYLEQELCVEVIFDSKSIVSIEDNHLTIQVGLRKKPGVSDERLVGLKIEQLFYAWLKIEAESYILPKVEYFSSLMSASYSKVSFKRYKARWGSCNSRAELTFNSLLMMCPPWIIEYVIIHELCHLTHLNHSSKFWDLVAQYCPNYKLAQKWLRDHSYYIR